MGATSRGGGGPARRVGQPTLLLLATLLMGAAATAVPTNTSFAAAEASGPQLSNSSAAPAAARRRLLASLPAYYTSASGYVHMSGFTGSNADFRTLSNYNNAAGAISKWTGISPAPWNLVHDKDLDSNVWYAMPESSHTLYAVTMPRSGSGSSTAVSQTTLVAAYSGATTSVLGACYAPAIMGGSSGATYGAFIIGGFSQAVVHVLEFNSAKTGVAFSYTVPYTSEVYGTEVRT